MEEGDNVRAFVAPAHAEEVRRCLLPFAKVYGAVVERAIDYVFTGHSPEVVEELMAAIIRFNEDADDAMFLADVEPLWTLQYALRKLTLLQATEEHQVALAARFLHTASPILAGDKSQFADVRELSHSEWFAISIAHEFEERGLRGPVAPYLALLKLLDLPEHFALERRLLLRETKDSLRPGGTYLTEWRTFDDLDSYVRRHPECWRQGLTHIHPTIRIHTFQVASAIGYDLAGLDSTVFDCAVGTRAKVRAEAQDFIAGYLPRFLDRIREAPRDGEASVRAASIELIERFFRRDEAVAVLETMQRDRSKKVRQRAEAALAVLDPSGTTEQDAEVVAEQLIEVDLNSALHEEVRAAVTAAHGFLQVRDVPSLEATLDYVERGVGDPPPAIWYDEDGEEALLRLASVPHLTLAQYLRFLRLSRILHRSDSYNADHLGLATEYPRVLSTFARARPSPPCLSEMVAVFRALGWQERGVTATALATEDVVEGWSTSRLVELREDDLVEMWRKPESSLFFRSSRDAVLPRLAEFCGSLPTLPDALTKTLWDIAFGNAITVRPHAQRALGNKAGVEARILEALGSKRQGVRCAAAIWAADASLTEALPMLHDLLKRERSAVTRDAVLDAIVRLGGSIESWITPQSLQEAAELSLRKGVPEKLSWFSFDSLPELKWSAGDSVDPIVATWLVVQAHALKSPNPSGQLRRIVGKLAEESARALSSTLLQAWLATDSTANKGLLGLVVIGGDAETVDQARRYIYKYYGTAQGQCFALLRMVSEIDVPDSLLLLQQVARRFRTESIQEEAARIIDDYAAVRGWSRAELGDRTTPTAGLDKTGRLGLSFGQSRFTVELDPTSLLLVIHSESGRVCKSLPKPRVNDDPAIVAEAKRQLLSARRQVKAVVTDRKAALYEAMCLERRWPFEVWKRHLCEHPITGVLCRRLVWFCESGDAVVAFRPIDDGAFADVHGAPLLPSSESRVWLAHDTLVSDEVRAAWAARLESEGVETLFPQFDRMSTIRRVFPTYSGGLPQIKGISVNPADFYHMAQSAGFAKGPREDGGRICEFLFQLPSSELVGVLACEGVDPALLPALTREVYEALAGKGPKIQLEGLTICKGAGYDRELIDLEPKHSVPTPFVVEFVAAAAKSIGEGLRLVRTETATA